MERNYTSVPFFFYQGIVVVKGKKGYKRSK